MTKKHRHKVAITQMTQNGAYVYSGCETLHSEAEFTSKYNHCTFNHIKLKKIKGGSKGGNYVGIENNEVYFVASLRFSLPQIAGRVTVS